MPDNQQETEICFQVTNQGSSLAISRKKQDNQWVYGVERNEFVFPDEPGSEDVQILEEDRSFYQSEHNLTFDAAIEALDLSEWFLFHPEIIHADIARTVYEKFKDRMGVYNQSFPPTTPLDKFIRESRQKEWLEKTSE